MKEKSVGEILVEASRMPESWELDDTQQRILGQLEKISEDLDAYHNEIGNYQAIEEAHREEDKKQAVKDAAEQRRHSWIVAIIGGGFAAIVGGIIGAIVSYWILPHG